MPLELYPYQAAGVDWIRAACAAHGAALLADDMGAGKSGQFLMAPPPGAPLILSVPALLKPQTAERAVLWRGTGCRVEILDGVGSFRAPRSGECVVVNPDIFPTAPREVSAANKAIQVAAAMADGHLPLNIGAAAEAKAAEKRLAKLARRGQAAKGTIAPGTWLVIDECHEFGSYGTAQTTRARALIQAVRAAGGFVVGASATVLVNDPGELSSLLTTFGLGGIAHPSKKGRSLDYFGFLRAWGGAPGRHGGVEWMGQPRHDLIVPALRRVMLRRLFRDVCPNVPTLMPHREIRVDLDATTLELANHADAMIRGRAADLWASGREDKVSFELIGKVRAALAVAKLPAAQAWCDDMERAGEPAVVACVSVDVARTIGARDGWGRITGSESSAARAETVAAFQAGRLRGVAITHAAGGVGIDLYRAAHMLIVSREWNPAKNRQSLARLYRQGQTRHVTPWFLFAAHPLEERFDELLRARRSYMQAIDACAERAA
jgi:hypothetical protein